MLLDVQYMHAMSMHIHVIMTCMIIAVCGYYEHEMCIVYVHACIDAYIHSMHTCTCPHSRLSSCAILHGHHALVLHIMTIATTTLSICCYSIRSHPSSIAQTTITEQYPSQRSLHRYNFQTRHFDGQW